MKTHEITCADNAKINAEIHASRLHECLEYRAARTKFRQALDAENRYQEHSAEHARAHAWTVIAYRQMRTLYRIAFDAYIKNIENVTR